MDYNEFCIKRYSEIYMRILAEYGKYSQTVERAAQKQSIRDTAIEALKQYGNIDAERIWQAIYAAHIHRKSGVAEVKIINSVISADNSWKKSSGHAFEEAFEILGNDSLNGTGIKLYLQRDITSLIHSNKLSNEERDIGWLKDQLEVSNFDLFMTVEENKNEKLFACVQTKTSIRDRVTRDREPSTYAMQAFFWSIAVVLDGKFLGLPKFKYMVNGGSTGFPTNGWHGMYVFSDKFSGDRIFPVGTGLKTFSNHAQQAAKAWLTQRQWMDPKWRPSSE